MFVRRPPFIDSVRFVPRPGHALRHVKLTYVRDDYLSSDIEVKVHEKGIGAPIPGGAGLPNRSSRTTKFLHAG